MDTKIEQKYIAKWMLSPSLHHHNFPTPHSENRDQYKINITQGIVKFHSYTQKYFPWKRFEMRSIYKKKKTEKTIITTMTATETETKIKSKKCIILLVFKRIRHFLRELKSIKSNITGFFFLQFMWSCWFCYFFSCVLNPPFTFWPKSHVKFSGARLFFRRILSFFSHFYIKTTTVTFIGHHWFPFSLVFFSQWKATVALFFIPK